MGTFVRSINWDKLREQKLTLVKLAGENKNRLTTKEQDDLDGVVHLIDALQDWAVGEEGAAEELVFPGLGEDDGCALTDQIDEINKSNE